MNTIFWSWQSDLDARVTRDLIRDALAGAIADLDAELDERHELTSDTKGAPGSPDIVATILARIAAAKVFVGDATPLAVSDSGKALANPNVLIELGYAKHAIGLERVILVWNTAFHGATIEQLPFDMRGRRAPLGFHLPPGTPTAELRIARDGLRKELRNALQLSIAAATPAVTLPEPVWQTAGPSPALWFDPAEMVAINEDGRPGSKAIGPGPYSYIRILPRRWQVPADFGVGTDYPAALGPTGGHSRGTTRGGALIYSGSTRSANPVPLVNLAMQFRTTGEIWGVDPTVLSRQTNRFFADTAVARFFRFLEDNLPLLERFSISKRHSR